MNLTATVQMGQLRERPYLAYSVSVLAVAAATALTFYLPPLHEAPTDLYFAAIAAVAWWCGKGPAVLATVVSTLAVDFFIIPPVFSILLDVADLTRFLIFGFVALLICYLQDRYQHIALRLQEANSVLDARVQQRTAELATANQSLRREIGDREAAAAALIESEGKLRVALGHMELSLKEKEILIRELNHRVKNNLQIITSLLSLQGSKIQDRASRDVFKECQHRVRAIAMVHQRLYGAPNLTEIDLAAYFKQLTQELLRSYYGGAGNVTCTVSVDQTTLNIDQLVPCALVVNELVSNALKYAFPNGKSGEVRVELHRQNGQLCLSVADDGVGFTPNEAPRQSGIGLAIVQALCDQLGGELQWSNQHGTRAQIAFSEKN